MVPVPRDRALVLGARPRCWSSKCRAGRGPAGVGGLAFRVHVGPLTAASKLTGEAASQLRDVGSERDRRRPAPFAQWRTAEDASGRFIGPLDRHNHLVIGAGMCVAVTSLARIPVL